MPRLSAEEASMRLPFISELGCCYWRAERESDTGSQYLPEEVSLTSDTFRKDSLSLNFNIKVGCLWVSTGTPGGRGQDDWFCLKRFCRWKKSCPVWEKRGSRRVAGTKCTSLSFACSNQSHLHPLSQEGSVWLILPPKKRSLAEAAEILAKGIWLWMALVPSSSYLISSQQAEPSPVRFPPPQFEITASLSQWAIAGLKRGFIPGPCDTPVTTPLHKALLQDNGVHNPWWIQWATVWVGLACWSVVPCGTEIHFLDHERERLPSRT